MLLGISPVTLYSADFTRGYTAWTARYAGIVKSAYIIICTKTASTVLRWLLIKHLEKKTGGGGGHSHPTQPNPPTFPENPDAIQSNPWTRPTQSNCEQNARATE